MSDAAYKNAISGVGGGGTTNTTTTTTPTTNHHHHHHHTTTTTTTTTITTTTTRNNTNMAAPFTTPFQIYQYTQNVLLIEHLSRQFFAPAHEAHKPQSVN
jgi:hypothetical protein